MADAPVVIGLDHSLTSTGLPSREPDVQIIAIGRPKPKGSLRHVGRGRMVEQLEGSAPWREAVKWAAVRSAIRTLDGPLLLDAIVTVPKPASAPKRRRTWPITRSSGDIDKHARNILDALDDASAYGDDSQVVDLRIRKVYPLEGDGALAMPGAAIRIWQIGDGS